MKKLNILIICSLIFHTSCVDVNIIHEKLESSKGFKELQIGKNINEFDSYILSSKQYRKSSTLNSGLPLYLNVMNYEINYSKLKYNKYGVAKINRIHLVCINDTINKIEIGCSDYDEISDDLISYYGMYDDYTYEKNDYSEESRTYTWISENIILICLRYYGAFHSKAQYISSLKGNLTISKSDYSRSVSITIKSKKYEQYIEDIRIEEKKNEELLRENESKRIELQRKKEALKNF